MVDDDLLGKIFTLPAAAWTATLAFIAYLVRNRNERLRDLNTEKSGDWERIRHERDVAREECNMVRDRWAECEAERIKWMGRAVKAEATLQGYGDAFQQASLIVAAERLVDADKRRSGDGNGGDNG